MSNLLILPLVVNRLQSKVGLSGVKSRFINEGCYVVVGVLHKIMYTSDN